MPRVSDLHTTTLAAFPVIPDAQRREIASGAAGPELHARLLRELGLFECVEVEPPPDRLAEPRELRLGVWNLERGRHLAPAAGVLSRAGTDVALLSEMDLGMARSAQHHTVRELAGSLRHGFVYGVEFLELGLGGPEERARCAGQENVAGLHGGAITSALPIRRPAVVRLDRSDRWFDGAFGERRVGTRIAVLGTVRAGGVDVTFASVHLESHTDPAHRAEQMQTLLEAVERYAPGAPAVVAGDLNTFSVPTAWLADPDRLADALKEDPERLLHPEPHEPLFERAREAGFEWKAANVADEGTSRRIEPDGSSRRIPVHIDWILVRGLRASQPRILEAIDLATGQALSDHEPMAVTLRPFAIPPGSSG